jgi:hypothetical protein
LNPGPHEAQLEGQKPRKSQEGRLEEGKIARPTKGMKSIKPRQNGNEELRKAQKHIKNSQNSKTPPNTLNASSPLRETLSCFFSQPLD